jgi:glycosyltransferase involved in cell wall biosynthesis
MMDNKVIYVNARFLTQPLSGVQRFGIEISKELMKIGFHIVLLSPKNILHHKLSEELNVRTIGVLKGHLWEQIELQSYVFFKKGLLISFCNTAPLFLKNQMVTVHDLCFRKHPQWFSKPFSLWYNFMIPRICNNSKYIFTVSETSKQELQTELGIPAKKIHVIYNGVAEVFEKNHSHAAISPLVEEYILVVSSHHPRKNFDRLIKAFSSLEISNLKLCIVGNINRNFNVKSSNKEEGVHYLKNIDDFELYNYYKHAKLFVFPSLYEGFGIPIIEAMKFGVPVCVSDIPVFREICDSNAIYFNPYDVTDMKNRIEHALTNPVKPILNNTSVFDWNLGAAKIYQLIKKNYTQ